MWTAQAQWTMHNFDVSDSQGLHHELYRDYLDSGKTVVIKFFFTSCPPCIAITPWWQERYEYWGEGLHDVEFFEVTTIVSDNSSVVQAFKNQYGLTMITVGHDGGAPSIVNPFKNNIYGSWYGTPAFAVIAPDRSMRFPVFQNQLDQRILETGAQPPTVNPPAPTTFNINVSTIGLQPTDNLKFYVANSQNLSQRHEVMLNSTGRITFDYPSTQIPSIENPVLIMENNQVSDYSASLSASDLFRIQRHILGLEPFEHAWQPIAADANKDNKITAADLSSIMRVILGIRPFFGTALYSHAMIPDQIPLNVASGQTVNNSATIIKIGHVQ